MSFVLDNSVTMRWFFEDGTAPALAYADKVLAIIGDRSAIVPLTWGLEVANVLTRAEAKGSVKPERVSSFVEMLKGMDIEVDHATFEHALSDTLELARTYKLSAYDASYLELAIRRGIPMATLDEVLQKAARRAGVELFRHERR